MTDPTPSPSPYAAGVVTVEAPAPVRPAGSPVVFLWAVFVVALTAPGNLWDPWMRTLLEGQEGDLTLIGLYRSFAALASVVAMVVAYLSDRLPVLGSRREGYLVLTGAVAVATWVAAPFLPWSYGVWTAAGGVLTLATTAARTVSSGALAEVGRRTAATGRLAAGQLVLIPLAGLAASPLLDLVLPWPFGWTAALGGAAALSIVLLVLMVPERAGAGPLPELAPGGLPVWVRSRRFWGPALVLVCAAPGNLVDAPLSKVALSSMQLGADVQWQAYVLSALGTLAAGGVYVVACRRVPLARLLPAALVLEGLCLLAMLAWRAGAGGYLAAAIVLAFGNALASMARLDMVWRAVPAGREASGSVLMFLPAYLPQLVLGVSLVSRLGRDIPSLSVIVVLVVASLFGVLAVRAVPRAIMATRDGERG